MGVDMKAFPTHDSDNLTDPREKILSGGMDLRDWFAGMALQGIAANNQWNITKCMGQCAYESYLIADAMMKAREEQNNG